MTHCHHNVTKRRLFSLKELVEHFGGTIWFWRSQIWSGNLPVLTVGKKQWIDSLDLEEFINNHKSRLWEEKNKPR
jgi:hypothetical protein